MNKILNPKYLLIAVAIILTLFLLYYYSLNSKRERFLEKLTPNPIIYDSGNVYMNYSFFNQDTLETIIDIGWLAKKSNSSYEETLARIKDINILDNMAVKSLSNMPSEHIEEAISLKFSHYQLLISDFKGTEPFYGSKILKIKTNDKANFIDWLNSNADAGIRFQTESNKLIIMTSLEEMATQLNMPYEIAESSFKDDSAIKIYTKVMIENMKQSEENMVSTLKNLGFKYVQANIVYRDGKIESSSIEKIN